MVADVIGVDGPQLLRSVDTRQTCSAEKRVLHDAGVFPAVVAHTGDLGVSVAVRTHRPHAARTIALFSASEGGSAFVKRRLEPGNWISKE